MLFAFERVLFRHQSEVTKVLFHPHKALLLSAAKEGAVVLWDVEKSASYGLSMDHTSAVLHAAFSCDGQHMVTAARMERSIFGAQNLSSA